jgi:carbon-monoxide dehydrogenase large subunit
MAANRFVGSSVRRIEDPRLVRGLAHFIEDLELPGALHVAFARSPYGHAVLRSAGTAAARAIPEVVAALAGSDLRSNPAIPVVIPQADLRPCQQHALSEQRLRYVGDPFALVAAESRYAAEDGVQELLLASELEPLPAVVEAERALVAEAPLLHAEAPGNLLSHFHERVGDPDLAFGTAAVVLRDRFRVQRYVGLPLEPRGVLTQFDAGTGQLTLWSSTQWPHTVREALAMALKLPLSMVRVVAPAVGGGFGVKQEIYPEELALAVATMQIERPLKWVETRREHLASANHAREQLHDVELAATEDGRITALKVRVTTDQGAYSRSLGALCPSITASSMLGPYRIRDYAAEVRVVATNKSPAGAYRGAGGPEAVFALERMVDRLADRLQLDSAELRRRNFIRPDEFPWNTGLGSVQVPVIYDSGDYAAVLERALELCEYDRWRAKQRTAREEGRLLGIGLAAFVLLGGLGPYESAIVRLEGDGRPLVVTGASPHGQGTATALAQIVADELGVEHELVSVQSGDTSAIPYGVGTYASRNAVTAGSAVAVAAGEVRQQVLRLAARLLEASVEDLELVGGRVLVRGAPERAISLGEVAAAAAPERALRLGLEPGLEARHYFDAPQPTFSNGVHLAVVEVDRETGQVRILDYVAVNDAGRRINPQIVDGQLLGGIAQGLGGALWEEIAYDEDGQLLSGSLMDYAVPTSTSMPPVKLAHLETPSPLNPLGVKGLGEGGVMAPPPVLAAAVEDALRPLGITIDRTPLSAPRMRGLIESALQSGDSASA